MTAYSLFRNALISCFGSVVLLWIMGLSNIALSVTGPIVIGHTTSLFVNQTITPRSLILALVLIFASYFGRALIIYLQHRTKEILNERVTLVLRTEMLNRVVRFPAQFFGDSKVEEVTTRFLEDSEEVSIFFLHGLINIPVSAINFLVLSGIIISNNWFIGICIIPFSILHGYSVFLDSRIQRNMHDIKFSWDSVRVMASELLSAVSLVRINCTFDYSVNRVVKTMISNCEAKIEKARIIALLIAGSPLIIAIQLALLYGLGAFLCLQGNILSDRFGPMNWGSVIEITFLIGLFQDPVRNLANTYIRWREAQTSIWRLGEYLAVPQAFDNDGGLTEVPIDAPISLKNVSVVTGSGVSILEGLDASFEAGSKVAIVGPAGSGKSTLMNLLIRSVEPVSGTVRVGDNKIRDYQTLALAREIGHVAQKPILFDTSVRENLLIGLRRPSDNYLEDEEGKIDLTTLPGISSLKQLDELLCETLESVGLHEDIFQKFLDYPIPDRETGRVFIDRIKELRLALSEHIDPRCIFTSFVPFRTPGLFPGSMLENIWGPGAHANLQPQKIFQKIWQLTGRMNIAENLLQVGYHGIISGLSNSSLSLLPILRRSLAARQAWIELERSDSEHVCRSLMSMKKEFRQALLDAFLSMPSHVIESERWGGSELVGNILALRNQLRSQNNEGTSWLAVDQDLFLHNVPMRQNLLGGSFSHADTGREDCDKEIQQILVSQDMWRDALLMGLEFEVGEYGSRVSGGQQGKIAIAAAQLKNPSILLFDEASANLDKLSQARIIKMLEKKCASKTVLFISHKLSSIQNFDEVMLIHHGRIIQRGRFSELTDTNGLIKSLLGQDETGRR